MRRGTKSARLPSRRWQAAPICRQWIDEISARTARAPQQLILWYCRRSASGVVSISCRRGSQTIHTTCEPVLLFTGRVFCSFQVLSVSLQVMCSCSCLAFLVTPVPYDSFLSQGIFFSHSRAINYSHWTFWCISPYLFIISGFPCKFDQLWYCISLSGIIQLYHQTLTDYFLTFFMFIFLSFQLFDYFVL